MVELSDKEQVEIAQKAMHEDGACFHCTSRNWMAGPCGGASQNIMCDVCGQRLNILNLGNSHHDVEVLNVIGFDVIRRDLYANQPPHQPLPAFSFVEPPVSASPKGVLTRIIDTLRSTRSATRSSRTRA